MRNEHSVAAHWAGEFDEEGSRAWAEQLRAQFRAPRVDLGLVFMTPKFFLHAEAVLEVLRVHARVSLLAGCSSGSMIAGRAEIEENAGLVLGLYSLPGATLQAVRFTQEQVEEASGPLGLAGFFCNGEIGPVGKKNFLHGSTASLALFVGKS